MASKRISELAEETTPADDDLLVIVDVSDPDAPTGETKKCQAQNLVVNKLRTPTGPTVLEVGAVEDGEFLKRDGTSIVSAAIGDGLTTEQVQDIVGAMIVGGTDIAATYDDGAGIVTIDNTGGGGGGTTDLSSARPEFFNNIFISTKPGNSGSGTFANFGMDGGFTTTGSTTHQHDADGFWNVYAGVWGANAAGQINTAFTMTRTNWKPIWGATIKTGASIAAGIRIFAGLFSATSMGHPGSATPALHYVAFRYDTGVDGTAFWRCVSDNGSGTPEVTTTTTAITAATMCRLRIEVISTSQVKFYINDELVATHTGTLPTGSQNLGSEIGTKPLTSGGGTQIWLNQQSIIQVR